MAREIIHNALPYFVSSIIVKKKHEWVNKQAEDAHDPCISTTSNTYTSMPRISTNAYDSDQIVDEVIGRRSAYHKYMGRLPKGMSRQGTQDTSSMSMQQTLHEQNDIIVEQRETIKRLTTTLQETQTEIQQQRLEMQQSQKENATRFA